MNVLKYGQLSSANAENLSQLIVELLKNKIESNEDCDNQDESSSSGKDDSNE